MVIHLIVGLNDLWCIVNLTTTFYEENVGGTVGCAVAKMFMYFFLRIAKWLTEFVCLHNIMCPA